MKLWNRIFGRRDLLDRVQRDHRKDAKQMARRFKTGSQYSVFDDPNLAESKTYLRAEALRQEQELGPGEAYGDKTAANPELDTALSLLIFMYRMLERLSPGPPHQAEDIWKEARLNAISALSSVIDRKRAIEQVNRFEQRRRILCEAAPSGHHTAYHYWVMAMQQIRIEEAIRNKGWSLSRSPVVYFFPNGTVNARAFLLPESTESLVLFEGGMQPFTNQLSKIVVSAFLGATRQMMADGTGPDPSQLSKLLARDKSSRERFQRLLLAYLFMSNPIEGGFFTIQGPEAEMAGRIEDAMKLFALGHEYGHILAAHNNQSETISMPVEASSWRMANRSLLEEYDADRYGLVLMMEAAPSPTKDNVPALLGPDLFFTSLRIVQRALSIVKNGTEPDAESDAESSTHPSFAARRHRLQEIIQADYSNSQTAFAMMFMFETLLDAFFDDIKPLLQKYYAQKRPLAARWTSHVELFA